MYNQIHTHAIMKSFIAFFILASFLSLSFAQSEGSQTEEEKAGFLATIILRSLLSLNGRANTSHLLYTEFNNSLHCLANVRRNDSFCNVFINHFTECTRRFVDSIEASVEHRKIGLANALVTSIVSQVSFMCNTDGEHLFEILNPCVLKTFITSNKGEEAACMRHFMEELRSISKKDGTFLSMLCKALADAKNCIKGPFESNCPNAITRSTIEELYNSNTKVCD